MKNQVFILLLLSFLSKAQSPSELLAKADAIRPMLKTTANASMYIKTWKTWNDIIEKTNTRTSHTLKTNIENLCDVNINEILGNLKKHFYLNEKAASLTKIGSTYSAQVYYDKSIDYYTKSLWDLEAFKKKRMDGMESTLKIKEEKDGNLNIGLFTNLLAFLLIVVNLALLRKMQKNRQKLFQLLRKVKKQRQFSKNLNDVKLLLNKEKLETNINRKLNETDWSILGVITENPQLTNAEIAKKVFMSEEGVKSALKRMYIYFDIFDSRYKKISLVSKVSKLSIGQKEYNQTALLLN